MMSDTVMRGSMLMSPPSCDGGRLPAAQRVLRQEVAGDAVCAGARAAADAPEFAPSAAAAETIGIPQRREDRMFAVDRDRRIGAHVPGGQRQEAARLDV